MSKPPRILTRWSPILLGEKFVSLCGEDQYGQTWLSTTVAELDIVAMTATTMSGRPYCLHGRHDPDHALAEAVAILGQAYDTEGASIRAITLSEADAWLRGLPETPRLTEDERAYGEEHRRRQVWAWLRYQVHETGLSDAEAAGVAGLPVEVVGSLHRGIAGLGEVTTDEAEEALARIKEWRGVGRAYGGRM